MWPAGVPTDSVLVQLDSGHRDVINCSDKRPEPSGAADNRPAAGFTEDSSPRWCDGDQGSIPWQTDGGFLSSNLISNLEEALKNKVFEEWFQPLK